MSALCSHLHLCFKVIRMNYGNILYYDTANGIGTRTTLFVSGCRHHCKGCFNACTWDFNYGTPFTKEIEDEIINSLQPSYIAGITLLGGEPMEPENQPHVLHLIKRIRAECPHATVWIYSGYLWEELTGCRSSVAHTDIAMEILRLSDILIDGEFHMDERNLMLDFRGSENQRIIDIHASLQNNNIPVLSEYMTRRTI